MSTLVVYPATANDSAFQSSGGSVTAGSVEGAVSTASPTGATRFENVTLASSVTVSAATISVYGYNKGAGAFSAAIVTGVKEANPGVFTNVAFSLTTLLSTYPTTHTYSWTATLSTSAYVASGDISAIITELLAQGSWASGNAMAFIYSAGSTTSAAWFAYAHGSNYEELTITYTSGATYFPPIRAFRYAVNRASDW